MDFNYTEEQQMLADTVERFVADVYSLEKRRQLADTALGFSRRTGSSSRTWVCSGLPCPSNTADLRALRRNTHRHAGARSRAWCWNPTGRRRCVAARLIAASGTADQQARWLPTIADGTKRFALATFEPDARFDLHCIRSRAARTTSGYVLDCTQGGRAPRRQRRCPDRIGAHERR